MRKLFISGGAILAAVALSASVAIASVTFDPATGIGFVGKGDVQLVYGWNNAQLQANASGVTFTYSSTEEYEAVCEFWTGPEHNRQVHRPTRTKSATVNNTIERELRTNKQGDVTGFPLTGYGSQSSSGDEIPVVGTHCPGGPDGGTWTSVTQVSSSGGLFVHYLGGAGTQLA